MPRDEFSRKVKAEIVARAAGKCERCGAVLKKGEGHCDHILPDILGGPNKAANGQLLCVPCHKTKSDDDIRRVRKADRQRDKATGAGRTKKAPPQERATTPLTKALPERKRPFYRSVE
jgi:5-methylcytosine-specific restriction endonuclease McrA